jgi:WD40 repeat protein
MFGDFEIIGQLGAGGMGVVYRARQVSLNRVVALKMIRAGIWATDSEAQRFRNEAEFTAGLDHPSIVPVYEVGQEQGQLYFTMRLVEGASLAEDLAPFRVDPRRAAQLMSAVARAVHHAHQRGILHRDLKPSNILVDREGVPHVTDFGLAKSIALENSLTLTGAVIGTPGYLAPEQAAGAGRATVGTDIFGLGAIFYATLTGQPPFRGSGALEILDQTRTRNPASIRDLNNKVDRDLETVCRKCLEKEPSNRYQSAEDLAEDLDNWLGGRPIKARPVGAAVAAWRWSRRNPVAASFAALLLLCAATGMAGLAVSNHLLTRKQAETDAALALARQKERTANLHAYVANIRLARQALDSASEKEVNNLLARAIPEPGGEDFRGFAWYYLRRRCRERHTALPLMRGHEGAVYAAAYSPDGKSLATVGKDGTLRIWDPVAGRLRTTHRAGKEEINCVAFSPDGKALVTGDDGGVARLWTGPDYREAGEYDRFSCPVIGLAFSPDGQTLAAGIRTGHAYYWDFHARQRHGGFKYPGKTISAETVAFSPDGRQLAVSGGTVYVYDLPSGAAHRVAASQKAGNSDEVAFSHDGRLLVVSFGPRAVLFDRSSGFALSELTGHTGRIRSIAISMNDRLIATGSDDGSVRLWDAPSGRVRSVLTPGVWTVWCVAFSPDGSTLSATYSDGTIRRWPLDHLRDYRVAEPARAWYSASSPTFSPRDGSVALAVNGAVHVFSPDMKSVRQFTTDQPARGAFAFSPDGRRLAGVLADGSVRVWDVESREQVARLQVYKAGTRFSLPLLAFRPSTGGLLVYSDRLDSVVEWDACSGAVRATVAENLPQRSGSFCPDGRHLVYWQTTDLDRNDNRLTVLDLDSGEQHQSGSSGFIGDFAGMAYAPRSALLATVTGTRSIRFWDLETLEPKGMILAPGAAITNLAFSPDGRTLMSCGEDGIRLWNVELRQELFTLDSEKRPWWAAFLANDRCLISSNREDAESAVIWQADLDTLADDRGAE